MCRNAYRGGLLFVIILEVLVVYGEALRGSEPQLQNKTENREVNDNPPAEPRWELLDFYGTLPDESSSHRLKWIKIVLPEKKATPWQAGFTGDKPVVYTSDDPRILEAVEKFLTYPHRLAAGRHISCGDGQVVGTVRVVTNKEEFTIGVSTVGFTLDDESGGILQCRFYSWGLAHFIDDVCFQQAEIHIPPKVMSELTGESRMEQDRKTLGELRGKKSEKDNTNPGIRRESGAGIRGMRIRESENPGRGESGGESGGENPGTGKL